MDSWPAATGGCSSRWCRIPAPESWWASRERWSSTSKAASTRTGSTTRWKERWADEPDVGSQHRPAHVRRPGGKRAPLLGAAAPPLQSGARRGGDRPRHRWLARHAGAADPRPRLRPVPARGARQHRLLRRLRGGSVRPVLGRALRVATLALDPADDRDHVCRDPHALHHAGRDLGGRLAKLRHDRGVVRSLPRTVETVHRRAATLAPAATREPIEPQPAAPFGPGDQRRRHAHERARLLDALEPNAQRRPPVVEAIPGEIGIPENVEHALPGRSAVRMEEAREHRAVGPRQHHDRVEEGVPPAAAIEGVRVEVAGEDDRPLLVCERREEHRHLMGALAAGAMDLEMDRDRDEGGARALDGRHYADMTSIHSLQVELDALGAG